jgi:ferric-dicitrate binding protein FerR (iron transport regulator)
MSRLDQPANDEAAALWFAKCRRGVMTLEERAALDAWRRDTSNAAALAQLERAWDLLEDADVHGARTPAPVARQLIARSALLAVMCAFFIGIGVISYSGNHEFWTTLDWVER